jgi:deoxyribodipyrimidine photo-lyase
MTAPTIVWFRRDLRLTDNPALTAAVDRGGPVVPLYILDDDSPGAWRPGGASRWWLHHSLAALAADLNRRGAPLVLKRGRADTVVPALIAETGAAAVHWNRCYEPWATARDTTLTDTLAAQDCDVRTFNTGLLVEPWAIATKSGGPYRVFTPFWRAVMANLTVPAPAQSPASIPGLDTAVPTDRLEDWTLLPTRPDWAGGLRATWTPGEASARDRLAAFLDNALDAYAVGRDRPDIDGTSRLSPHLHWGEIGPRQVWSALDGAEAAGRNVDKVRSELGWREFSHHLLHHFPDLPERNLRPAFDAFPWAPDDAALTAWQRGETGYPLIDAGMRQLWQTGWMHNRVRMVAASFLVKHLLQPWQVGARWFWDTLVDADLANNSASWQWVAGCGADAAPYFRIFNPVRQGEQYDPDGAYVRRWIPELAALPRRFVHTPWRAPAPPTGYPAPIIDLQAGRNRALAAYDAMKAAAADTDA